jgi:hypothetical protein
MDTANSKTSLLRNTHVNRQQLFLENSHNYKLKTISDKNQRCRDFDIKPWENVDEYQLAP